MIESRTLLEILQEQLPNDAEVDVIEHPDDFLVRFSWLLHSDPDRPYKRSKNVVLRITQNAMQDFANLGNKKEAKALIDFETWIKSKLATFDPEHDMPKGKPEPIVKWEVGSLHYLENIKLPRGITRRMF